ncbi:MAG: AMP-binding protein [Treponema sp.]|jgi:fatty-acyl-CoA synthase|nr:AMP-binding protein [Treponema sp.]
MHELLEITLGAAQREQTAKRGNKEFLVYPNRNIRHTFSEFGRQVDRLTKGLLATGFKKGDHIGIWANNVPEWAVLFYAAARLGVVVVPLNISYKPAELGYIIGQADIKGLFIIDRFRDQDCAALFYGLIPELKTSMPGELVSSRFPCLKMVITIGAMPHDGLYGLDALINRGNSIADAELARAESLVSNTDVACIMYTSGTTGVPKGAMLTHRNVINNGYLANRTGVTTADSVVLNPLPFFYITSLTGGIVEAMIYGFKVVCPEGFDPQLCLSLIETEECTWLFAVPTMYVAMLNHPRFGDFSLKSVEYGCIGGTVCPSELMKTVMQRFHMKGLYLAYGLTETSPFITDCILEDSDDPRLSTVGSPLPGVDVSIRDLHNFECPVNTQGEICARGHNIMQGYYKMEEASAEAIDRDGWFHTGDLGHLLPDGYLVFDGRIKEVIIRGAEKVYPREVEGLLAAMPGIKDVQVTGIPSKKYGEEVGAFIVLQEGARVSEGDVVEFCNGKISYFKIPKYIFFVDSFPLSGSGKVQKFKLSQQGLKEVQEKGLST